MSERYEVTGVDCSGRRFKMRFASYMQAMCVNLFNGTVWRVNKDGRRSIIKRVYN